MLIEPAVVGTISLALTVALLFFQRRYRDQDAPWPAVGSAQYTTTKSSTWITITAPSDGENQTVGCKIYGNDELVVEETSDSGTVSCEYDAD